MFFQKKADSLAERAALAQSPWAQVWWRFRKASAARWSWRVLLLMVVVALLADFIANEKPLYCKLSGRSYFPVLKQYAVDLGFAKWDTVFLQKSWGEHAYEAVVHAPIPYSSHTLDHSNNNYRGPFAKQNLRSWRWRHWLGTDQLGRDVAAGMVSGTRVALLVGIISMGIATALGLLLGSLAGYFGDDGKRVTLTRLVLNLLALPVGWFYGFTARGFALSEASKNGSLGRELLLSIGIVVLVLTIANGLAFLSKRVFKQQKTLALPLDLLIMRAVEVMNSIPGMLLLLALVALIGKSSLFYVVAIIGLLRWTGVARFLRAELLRVRSLGYVEAARAMGLPDRRILWRHALPNALGPVLIVVAFGVASAILMESTLSFLGLGTGLSGATWGSMLSEVRRYPSAWWLAVFPGGAIFVAVTVFNLIGDGLSEAMSES